MAESDKVLNKYAPVLIPTVNRYEHFRRCIESLAKCTWADRTDVFVAVDYPAKEEHWLGYERIKKYLYSCGNLSFKSLNVIYRDHNYFYTSYSNAQALVDEVFKTYDRYIFSEDDNVFSPNFLVYMNKGLVLFENDQTVYAINGYKHFYPIRYGANTFYRQNVDFSAWGYGIWKNRRDLFSKKLSKDYFLRNLTWNTLRKIKKNGNNRLVDYLYRCNSEHIKMTDTTVSVILAIEDMDVVNPCVSLVRNIGWDASGEHCKTDDSSLIDSHNHQLISNDEFFEYIGSGKEFYNENKKTHVKYSYGRRSFLDLIIAIAKFLVKRFLNY